MAAALRVSSSIFFRATRTLRTCHRSLEARGGSRVAQNREGNSGGNRCRVEIMLFDCLDSKKLTYNGLLRSNKEYSRLESIRSKEYLIHNYYWWREKLRYTSNCEYFLLLLVDDDNYGANFWSLYRRNIWWISLLTIDWNKHIACCMLRWIPSVATSPWNLRLPATGPGNLYLKSRKCYTLHTWPIITRKYEAN